MTVSDGNRFRAGYVQFAPVFGDVEGNLEAVLRALEPVNAEIVVLPELPFTGYGFTDREELLSLAEEPESSRPVAELVALCGRKDMHVVTGFAEKSGDRCFNSALLLGPAGISGRYRKLHLSTGRSSISIPGTCRHRS